MALADPPIIAAFQRTDPSTPGEVGTELARFRARRLICAQVDRLGEFGQVFVGQVGGTMKRSPGRSSSGRRRAISGRSLALASACCACRTLVVRRE
jgi:hypothetical protein